MRQLLGCPQGHQWKYWGKFDPAKSANGVNCPVCGSADITPVPETISEGDTLGLDEGAILESSLTLDLTQVEPPQGESADVTLDFEGRPRPQSDDTAAGTLIYEEPSQATVDLEGNEPPRSKSDSTAIYESLPPADDDDQTVVEDEQADSGDDQTVNENDRTSTDSSAAGDVDFSLQSQLSESPDQTQNWTDGAASQFVNSVLSLGHATVAESEYPPDTSGGTVEYSDSAGGEYSKEPTEGEMDFETEAIEWPTLAGYEILGELGRGGMGVVYKARQTGLNRLVAIKMILGNAQATPQELLRFQIEAEAVAQLQHPNIVQIYEIGKHNGRPFFTLEFLEGDTLSRKVAKTPPTAKEAAVLVRSLADAMDFAHRRGIIHRDLKPANVLMAKNGEPKITDFGLAKKIEEDLGHTKTGAIMGTPSYMAPEQAEGKNKEIGPPADIYSLGAILYDLLTGRPPFRGETVLDTLNQVRTDEPVPPRRLQPKIPRDLQTICLTCLHKDWRRRYGSAGAMAEDLRRFASGEPILARPVPAWERAWKWAKRRPAAAALVVVSALGVIGMTFGGFVLAEHQRRVANRERDLRDIADQERDKAQKAQQRAEANFQHAQDAVKFFLTRIGSEQLANEPRMERIRRDVLRRAVVMNELFVKEKSDDVSVRVETANAYVRLGQIHQMLGEFQQARESDENAIDRFGQLAAAFPDKPAYRLEQAVAYNDLGTVLLRINKPKEAEKAFRESLRIKEALATQYPAETDYEWSVGKTYNNLGIFLRKTDRIPEAEEAYLTAKKRLGKLPDKTGYLVDLASVCMNLGVLLQETKRPDAAEENYRLALDLRKKVHAREEGKQEYRNELALSHFGLATLLQTRGRFAEAEREHESAINLLAPLAKEFPHTPDYQQMLAHAHQNVGVLLAAQKKSDEAQSRIRKAIQLRKELLETFKDPLYQKELADGYGELATVQGNSDLLDSAEESFRQAAELYKKLEDAFPRETPYLIGHAIHRGNLAKVYTLSRRWPEAEKSWLEVARLQKKVADASATLPDLKVNLAQTFIQLALLHLNRGGRTEARPYLDQAVAAYRAVLPLSARHVAGRLGLIEAYVLLEQHADAAREEKELRKQLPSAVPEYVTLAVLLSRCAAIAAKDDSLTEAKRKELAKAYGDEAIDLLRESLAKGLIDIRTINATPDFNVLSDRAEFKALDNEKR